MHVRLPSGISLEYEIDGPAGGQPLLLVMGLSATLIHWPEGFVHRLCNAGRRVIRFDNRDSGRSTQIDAVVDMNRLLTALFANDPSQLEGHVPYRLVDFADDAVGLLDHLGVERADVVGASLGGMIAQTMAIAHPQRVRTLTSIMSLTGEIEYGQASPQAMAALLGPSPTTRSDYIDAYVVGSQGWAGGRLLDLDVMRQFAAQLWDRGIGSAEASNRQLGAIIASGSRAAELRMLAVPTLVVHGTDDPLVNISGGRRTAELIPGARLVEIDGMGHDLPRPAWDRIVSAILELSS